MRRGQQTAGEDGNADDAGCKGENRAAKSPLSYFAQGQRQSEGGRSQGEVPLHQFEDGEMCGLLYHMELHHYPGDDEDHDEEGQFFVGAGGHDVFIIGEHACAQEHDEENEQESCGHERVAQALHVVGPVPGLVAEAEGRVEHLARVAYAEHGENGEGLVAHAEGVPEQRQQKRGRKAEEQNAAERVDDLPALRLEHGHENGHHMRVSRGECTGDGGVAAVVHAEKLSEKESDHRGEQHDGEGEENKGKTRLFRMAEYEVRGQHDDAERHEHMDEGKTARP